MDIAAGYEWFEGPDFKVAHVFRTPRSASNHTYSEEKMTYDREKYSDDFLTFTYDFNGDGWIDILVVSTPGEDATWFENPGKEGAWKAHLAISVLDTESPGFADFTGDGQPDMIGATGGRLGYFTFDVKNPTAEWKFHPVSGPGHGRYTHGIGIGDITGDGRPELLEANGWWDRLDVLDGDGREQWTWRFHAQKFGAQGGAQMYAYDVNGDGRADVITSLSAHGYGLSWFEQVPGAREPGWIEHPILGVSAGEAIGGVQFSQPHAVMLEDMDGDGLKDIVTGKRYLAHGSTGDVDPLGTPVLYWFKLTRTPAADAGTSALKLDISRSWVSNVTYTPHLIDDASGVGTQFAVGDLNGDKRPDIAVVNKHGAIALVQK